MIEGIVVFIVIAVVVLGDPVVIDARRDIQNGAGGIIRGKLQQKSLVIVDPCVLWRGGVGIEGVIDCAGRFSVSPSTKLPVRAKCRSLCGVYPRFRKTLFLVLSLFLRYPEFSRDSTVWVLLLYSVRVVTGLAKGKLSR